MQAERELEQMGFAERMEKQIGTIEALIRDKQMLTDKVETLIKQVREGDARMETMKAEMLKEFKVQAAKEREVWAAKEKVQREKWEAERVQAIRASAYQQMEPTL